MIIQGTNSPGFSPAAVAYGSATFGATGKLIAELGGTSAGSGYDQINLSGAAELAGVPAVELRAVSNLVDECDRSRWRFEDALAALREALPRLLAELQ